MKYSIIILLLAISSSCHRTNSNDANNIFIGKTIRVNDFPQTLTLQGEHLPISSLGANNIYIIDTFLVFLSYQTDNFYSIYSTNNHKHILNVLPKGRGVNELEHASSPLFYKTSSNSTSIFYSNRGRSTINELNITKSIQSKTTYIEDRGIDISIQPEVKGAFPLNDSSLFYHYFNFESCNEYYSIYNFRNKIFIQKDSIYKAPLTNAGHILFWNNFSCFNPQQLKYATAMQFLNQINIYTLKQKQAISIVYGNISNFKNVVECPMPEKYVYYIELISTNKLLFGLYANQTRKDWATKDNLSTEIHVIDWNGNPKYKLITREKLADIAIDEKHKILYGITQEEKVYLYKLPQLEL